MHQIAFGQIPLARAPIPDRVYQCQKLVEGGIAQRCMRNVFIEWLKPHAPSIAVVPGPNWGQVVGDSYFAS
jgi:hypothetical protein